jgi:WD40 repeat protein
MSAPEFPMNSDALAARIGNLLGSSASGSGRAIPSRPPPPVPDHEIITRIGGGSYGEVWLARSVTGALRAVKVVWRSHFASERPYEREFHGIVQFEPISRSHPGVVNILHVGRDDAAGCFFYVMELADKANDERRDQPAAGIHSSADIGPSELYSPRTLASDLISRERLPVTDAVSLGVQLAGALGHLHRHGLVHRDVKPSNVIFVHGQAKLADIGLVTGVHEERSFVGTEGFIPPEGPGSERADLFALGRLLYEAVTGKNRCDFPGLPDDLDRWPKSEREALIELNEVLARACAPEAKKRHSNAADLAGDLNLILAGRSVRRAYGIERQLRRATLISVAALAVVIASVSSNWLLRRQRALSDVRAQRETTLRQRAEGAEQESRQQLYAALLEQARATVLTAELGQRVRALDAVRRAAAISNSVALRGVAVAALALPDLRFERELPIQPDWTLVQLDPAFERVALCRGNGLVEIRSVSDQRLLATLPASTNRAAYVASWSSDGRFLAVKRDHDTRTWRVGIEVWDVAAARRVLLLNSVTRSALSFHPRLPRLVVGMAPAAASIWDVARGVELAHHPLEGEAALVKFSPDGEHFAALHAAGGNWTITGYRADSGETQWNYTFPDIHPGNSSDFNWHPDGRRIAVTAGTGIVGLIDLATGEAHVLGRHKAQAVVTVFSPDGRYLFTGGWDRELICWDVKAMRRAFTIGLESYRMQVRADGRQCAILRVPDMRVQLHAFEPPALHRELVGDLGGSRNYADFSPDGRWLAASGAGTRLAVWDLTSNGPAALLKQSQEAHVNFAPNGELFCSRIGDCSRWKVLPGTNGPKPILQRLGLATPAGFSSLSMISNGVVFNSTGGSKIVSFEELGKLPGAWHPTGDGRVAASHDGRWLGLQRRFSTEFFVHRLPGLERIATLTHSVRIRDFEFSPKGDELAVATQSEIEFWSTTNWQRTRHLTNASSILYSPDGRTFWLSSGLRAAGLHDARTAELLLPLPANTVPLATSPDGHHLAACLSARYIQVWDLAEVRLRLRELGLDWAETH